MPLFFQIFAEYLSANYDFVLIDSRTGLTDAGGICTMLMPDKLVLVFTPNNQSLEGVLRLARQAKTYRANSSDSRSLFLYPVPSRIEDAETKLQEQWRKKYEDAFENLFKEVYKIEDENIYLNKYFNSIQIKHTPQYAYGEKIATAAESTDDLSTLAFRYNEFLGKLLGDEEIWTWSENGITKENKTINIFVSYSHADEAFIKTLNKHLASLKRTRNIAIWTASTMSVGSSISDELNNSILLADVILIMLSADLLNTNWFWDAKSQ